MTELKFLDKAIKVRGEGNGGRDNQQHEDLAAHINGGFVFISLFGRSANNHLHNAAWIGHHHIHLDKYPGHMESPYCHNETNHPVELFGVSMLAWIAFSLEKGHEL